MSVEGAAEELWLAGRGGGVGRPKRGGLRRNPERPKQPLPEGKRRVAPAKGLWAAALAKGPVGPRGGGCRDALGGEVRLDPAHEASGRQIPEQSRPGPATPPRRAGLCRGARRSPRSSWGPRPESRRRRSERSDPSAHRLRSAGECRSLPRPLGRPLHGRGGCAVCEARACRSGESGESGVPTRAAWRRRGVWGGGVRECGG